MYVPTLGEHVTVPVYKGTMVLEVERLERNLFYGGWGYWVIGPVVSNSRPVGDRLGEGHRTGEVVTVSSYQIKENKQ